MQIRAMNIPLTKQQQHAAGKEGKEGRQLLIQGYLWLAYNTGNNNNITSKPTWSTVVSDMTSLTDDWDIEQLNSSQVGEI